MKLPVFADTFYFLALVNPRDAAHEFCVSTSESMDRPLVTTGFVLMEVGDALRKGQNREIFSMILQDLRQDPDATTIQASQELLEKGIDLFRTRADKQWSLTDCTSFVVMSERNLQDALTADYHFEQAGFEALLIK